MTVLNDDETIDLMARVLRCREADLGEERDVIRKLNAVGKFNAREVLTFYERAIERAHAQNIEHGSFQ